MSMMNMQEMLRKNIRYVLIGAGLLLLVLLVRDFNSRMADLRRLTVDKEHVSAQVTSLAATRTYLEEQIEYAQSDEAVREWAYEQGKMAQPGDQVVVPLAGENSVDSPAIEPTPTPAPVQNWQLWLALFMDRSADSFAR